VLLSVKAISASKNYPKKYSNISIGPTHKKAFVTLIRRSGESRSPEDSLSEYFLDSGFHRNDSLI
jgi:hypothetical protein